MRWFESRIAMAIVVAAVIPARAADVTTGKPLAEVQRIEGTNTVRILFVGDSITGLGERMEGGFVRLMREALKQTSGSEPTMIALGGSGSGVGAWLNFEQRSQGTNFNLDVPGVDVRTSLDAGADMVVIMLGMNDTLAPNVGSDDKGLDDWIGSYRRLIDALRRRTKARVIGLATVTMATEDPESPMNRWHDRMNRRLVTLGKELGCPVLPTSEECWDIQREGRRMNPDFHATYDYVHLNATGNVGVAIGMLKGLGESDAAEWLRRERLTPMLNSMTRDRRKTELKKPPGWLVGTGFAHVWRAKEFDLAAARLPVDDAIEAGKNFTAPIDIGGGKTLTWQPYVPSIDYTGGASPGSVDFYAVTCPRTFEGGYAAKWIHSNRERPVKLAVCTQGFTAEIHVIVWLNGKQMFSGEAPVGTNKAATVEAPLQNGWNTLVFKSNHRAWLWQTSVDLAPVGTDDLSDLRYAIRPPKD